LEITNNGILFILANTNKPYSKSVRRTISTFFSILGDIKYSKLPGYRVIDKKEDIEKCSASK